MTLTVPNLNAPIVTVKGPKGEILRGIVVPPWNSFFQQFTQKPLDVQDVIVGSSPFLFTPNVIGQVVIRGGTISLVRLIRGTTAITMTERTILVSIGDSVEITYSVLPTVQFLQLF